MRAGKVISTRVAMAVAMTALGLGSVGVAQAGGYNQPVTRSVVTAPASTGKQIPCEVDIDGVAPVVTTSAQPEGGWRPAFNDGRLNPYRGPRSDLGDIRMARRWNNATPMEMIAPPPEPLARCNCR